MTHQGLIHQIRVVKYSSPYKAEKVYISDKGFTVRLKAMINRAMDDLGYNTNDEKFKAFMEFIGENGEDCLFAARLGKDIYYKGEACTLIGVEINGFVKLKSPSKGIINVFLTEEMLTKTGVFANAE